MTTEKKSWFQGFLATAKFEVSHVLSHPWEVFACLIMPLIWCVLIAGLLNDGLIREMPVGLVDMDGTPEAASFARHVDALPSVKLVPESRAEALEKTRAGAQMGYIVIPDGWSESRARTSGQSLELHISRTIYAVSTTLELDIKKALLDWSVNGMVKKTAMLGGTDGSRYLATVFEPYEVLIGNQSFNFRTYLSAALIPMVLGLAAVLSLINSLVREWRRGKLHEILMTAGGHTTAAVFGKVLPWFLIYSFYMTAYVGWFAGIEGNAPAGSLALWILAGFIYIAGITGIAILFTAVAPTWIIALILGILTTAPTIPFTGFSFPMECMPPTARFFFGQMLPLTWYIKNQAAQWVLASPLDHSLAGLGFASLFFIVSAAAGLPLICRRMRPWLTATDFKKEQPYDARVPAGFFETMRVTFVKSFFNKNTLAVFGGGIAFYLILYGWPYSNEQMTKIPVAVVDLDRTDLSRALIRELDGTSRIRVTDVLTSPAEAKDQISRQKVDVAVMIPKDFGADIGAGRPTRIGTYGTGALPAKVHAVGSTVMTAAQKFSALAAARMYVSHGIPAASLARSLTAPPALVTENLFNTIGGYQIYLVPMVGVLIVQSVMLMGITIATGDWLQRKRWPAFFLHAVRDPVHWVAFVFTFAAIAFFWMLYMEGFYFGFKEFNTLGNLSGTLLLSVIFSVCVACFALAITFMVGSNHYSTPLVILTSGPNVFLAGCIFPASNFAWWAKACSMLIPTTPAINGILATSQNGAATASVLPYIFHLLILTILYGTAARFFAKRRLVMYERGDIWFDD